MFTKTFTDPQGQTHTDAVFQVNEAIDHLTNREHYNYSLADGTETANINSNRSLDYQMFYWTSQQSKDDGNLPYILANQENLSEWFNVNYQEGEYQGLSAMEKAEKHCQDVVLT